MKQKFYIPLTHYKIIGKVSKRLSQKFRTEKSQFILRQVRSSSPPGQLPLETFQYFDHFNHPLICHHSSLYNILATPTNTKLGQGNSYKQSTLLQIKKQLNKTLDRHFRTFMHYPQILVQIFYLNITTKIVFKFFLNGHIYLVKCENINYYN